MRFGRRAVTLSYPPPIDVLIAKGQVLALDAINDTTTDMG
jgi:hypothetical protein